MHLRIVSLLLVAAVFGGCASRSNQSKAAELLGLKSQQNIPGFKTPTASNIKHILFKFQGDSLYVDGSGIGNVPGDDSIIQGPPLRLNTSVQLEVIPADNVVKPLIAFVSPQLDLKQKSKSGKFAFAITPSLLNQQAVDVKVQVNKSQVVTVHFDIVQ